MSFRLHPRLKLVLEKVDKVDNAAFRRNLLKDFNECANLRFTLNEEEVNTLKSVEESVAAFVTSGENKSLEQESRCQDDTMAVFPRVLFLGKLACLLITFL